MEYNAEVIDFTYNNILNNFTPFVLDGVLYLGKHVSSADLFSANSHLLLIKKNLQSNGVLSEYDIMKDAIEKGVWSHAKNLEIQNLRNDIKRKAEVVPKLVLPSQKKQVEAEIKILSKKISDIENEKSGFLTHSLERQLQSEKLDYICFLSIYKENKERLWRSYEDFLNESTDFSNKITKLYFSVINEMSNSLIRAIARVTDARYKLKIAGTKSPEDISIVFLELRQWCDFYNSIYELDDRPAPNIIEDDIKLDGWLSARKAKNDIMKSVNTSEGATSFGGIVGTKEDVEAFGGVSRDQIISLAKEQG